MQSSRDDRKMHDGIMVWAEIYGDKTIGPCKFDDGVKLTSQIYCYF